jgi:ligand-binding sensor domain-containing protein
MWFTSGRVLYRYNGYEFTTYKNNPFNPNSLAGEHLIYVFADKSGFIWVADFDHGLDKLDPQTGIFTHYRHNEKDASSISSDRVYNIIEDHEGYLWIGTSRGLNRLDKKTGKFISYKHDPDDPASLSEDGVRIVYEDRSGIIWVGTGGVWHNDDPTKKKGGLNRLDRKTGKFVHYLNDPNDPHSLIDNRVTAICEDISGIFWVGTAGDGLHTMDRATGKFERHLYDPAHPGKLSRPPQGEIVNDADDHITFIKQDVTGGIWIGTFEGGLSRYDPKTKLASHYEAKSDPDSLHEMGVWDMYSSREGVVWITTSTGNLYRIDPFQREIHHYVTSSALVHYFYEEPNGILWIGTHQELIRNDRDKGITKRYIIRIDSSIVNDNWIHIIKEDRQGNIWVGWKGRLKLME